MSKLPGPIFIGPVCVGKTTVSKLVAARLDRPRVELDEVAMPYYERCPEFDPARYNQLRETEGFLGAYRYWEPALVFALEQVVVDYPDAVLDLGAGHTSLLDAGLHSRVRAALAPFEHVVLVLPDPDPSKSASVIRQRCLAGNDRDVTGWVHDGFDFIDHWIRSDQNRQLATQTIYTGKGSAEAVADRVVALFGHSG